MLEWFAVIVFVLVLAVVATDWIHRTLAVLVGASIFVIAGVIDDHDAVAAVDLSTIGLLIGMMVVVAVSERTGIFEQMAIVALRLSKGRPLALVTTLSMMTGVMSAFLDNLTAILLVAPITIIVASKLGMPPAPLLILQVIASNLGGTATLVGDPPNIMIAGATGLSFNAFLAHLAPIAMVTLLVVVLVLYSTRRRAFQPTNPDVVIDDIQPEVHLAQGRDLWLPVGILLGTILLFFLHGVVHMEPATVALLGATAMLLSGTTTVEDALREVDWPTLFFFAGLFVMVGGLEEVGFLEDVAAFTRDLTDGSRTAELLGIMGIAAIGSAFVDNIPFTAAMIPVVEQLNPSGDDAYWWALALGACFGGNATIVAAAANVACQGVAERNGIRMTFMQFLAWGLPATLISLAMAAAYVVVRYT
jgi:Na+/H+ antiporter NhaD/arsenite permease-like protein